MENTGATKRTLDDDVEVNSKRLKFDDLQMLPSTESIRNVRDPRKWSQLPSIVYELLTLFKKSEKFDAGEDEKLKNVIDNEKEELQVLPNDNPKENIGFLQNSDEKNNSEFICTVESNKLSTFKSSIENSLQSIKFDFFKNEAENFEVQNNISSNAKKAPVQIIEDNCFQKVEQKEDEDYEKTSGFKKCTLTKTDSTQPTSTPMYTNENYNTIMSMPENIKSRTFTCTFTKNVSVTISNRPTSTLKSVSSIPITTSIDSATPVTISDSVFNKNPQKDMFKSPIREQIFNLLKVQCLKGISEIPTVKPTPCICQYCKHVDNLTLEKSALYNKSMKFMNNINLNTDMYSSDVAADSSETSKDVWINDLCSLIRKNDELHNVSVPGTNISSTLTSIKDIFNKVAEKIKPHLPFCKKCKKSKHINSSICNNCKPQLKNKFECYDPRNDYRNYNHKHGNNKFRNY